ncbi:hypothetical protein [Caldanaerobius fijiensis]|uniref:hypothetical protein n=1 Tax=Caldanaerobius fijiensis TaxID=456330 RepID=UPI001160D1BE|nr:hypothetical protein [Caldanaerobius fijiensis]
MGLWGEYLIGIDIGTSARKVSVFDADGVVVFSTSRAYSVYYPHTGVLHWNLSGEPLSYTRPCLLLKGKSF